MVFVADDFAAWLFETFADAGRKKLADFFLGTEQQRALREAATVAVQRTADELRRGDQEQAGQLAMVVSEVFGEPVPAGLLVGQHTLLEALGSRISAQLAVLDDASLTGTGQSAADVLGVPGAVVARALTGHLLGEILARGARGGSLAPLASQLNHDMTHLQGQRIEGVLGEVVARIERLGAERAVAAPAERSPITRVPRTEAERQQVLAERPPGWEYLYFAAELLHERAIVEDKYLDYEIESARLTGESVERSAIFGFVAQRLSDASGLAKKMAALVNNAAALQRAFGKPGQAGDPGRLAHLAKRWNSVYEEFLDWAARVRGVSAPSEFNYLLDLVARYAGPAIQQYRIFTDGYIAKVDALPAALAAGEKVRLEMRLTVALPRELSDAYNAEITRLGSQFQQRNTSVKHPSRYHGGTQI